MTNAHYADINGIRMYYEIHGTGTPLVLIHGGGSTLMTTFGRVLPHFAERHMVIGVELQAHGHTSDRDAPETFAQDAADVVELLRQLQVGPADILGFSNGGQTAMQIGISYPELVRKLVLASAFYKRSGVPDWFWEMMKDAQFAHMPQVYKDEFLKIRNEPEALINMWRKDATRMQHFTDWSEEDVRSITAPTLIIAADQDVMTAEHTVEMHRLIQGSQLAIFPGGHGAYMGEIMAPDPDSRVPELFVALVEEFLK